MRIGCWSRSSSLIPTPSIRNPSASTRTTTSPLGVNLIALLTRFISTCRRRKRVADERIGQFVGHLAHQFQALFVGPHAQGLDDLLDGLAEPEGRRLQLEPPRLDAGEVEDFVEEFQEQVGRFLGRLQVVAHRGRELLAQGQVGHAQDGVHRRAQFVAHAGQELALGDVGGLGGGLGLQLLLGPAFR